MNVCIGPDAMIQCGKFAPDALFMWEGPVLVFEGSTLGKQEYHENFDLMNGLICGWIYNLIAVLGTGR